MFVENMGPSKKWFIVVGESFPWNAIGGNES
jgi:hypothetical protein